MNPASCTFALIPVASVHSACVFVALTFVVAVILPAALLCGLHESENVPLHEQPPRSDAQPGTPAKRR